MSSCCAHPSFQSSTGKFFSKRSKRYARSYRHGKLDKIQRYLIDGIQSVSLRGKTILEIGCGVGSVHQTLLKNGAAHATGVDMSEQMLEHAKEFSKKHSLEDKTSYILGDFMTVDETIEKADVTILDKVLCCYEDVEGLIKQSTMKTNFAYGISIPAENLITEFLFKVHIFTANIFRFTFRPYWHNWRNVHQFILQQGFTLHETRKTLSWQMIVYHRPSR